MVILIEIHSSMNLSKIENASSTVEIYSVYLQSYSSQINISSLEFH